MKNNHILDHDHSTILQWIRSLDVTLPRLSLTTLEAEAKSAKLSPFDYLRHAVATAHPELAQLVYKTKSVEIRNAISARVRSAIVSHYPHLAEQLPKAWAMPVAPVEPATAAPAEAKRDAAEDGEADMIQLANTQLAALRIVHGYLVPAAAKEGITIDALQANGLVQNLLIQSYYGRVHQKFGRTKVEVVK